MTTILEAVLANLRSPFSPPPPPSMPLPLSAEWFAAQSAAREAAEPRRHFSVREYPSGPSPVENCFCVRQYASSGPVPELLPSPNVYKDAFVQPAGLTFG